MSISRTSTPTWIAYSNAGMVFSGFDRLSDALRPLSLGVVVTTRTNLHTSMETTYDYDQVGRVTLQAHPNGATTYFSYDLAGRLSEKMSEIMSVVQIERQSWVFHDLEMSVRFGSLPNMQRKAVLPELRRKQIGRRAQQGVGSPTVPGWNQDSGR
jgi:YD repeat-containing protein